MGLTNDSLPPSKLPHNPPSSSSQSKHEIDEIFSKAFSNKSAHPALTGLPPKKGSKRPPDEGPNKATADGGKSKKKKNKNKNKGSADEYRGIGQNNSSGTVPKSRRKTVDGLTIYGKDELGWNRKDAGGTLLCPFDCDCCF